MAANESVFLRSIRDVVGEVLRDLRASVAERAFYRLDWLLNIVNRYADLLSTTVDLDQVHFLLREARECLCLLDFNPALFFFLSKVLSRIIFSILFRVSNHQIVDKKNSTEFAFYAFMS